MTFTGAVSDINAALDGHDYTPRHQRVRRVHRRGQLADHRQRHGFGDDRRSADHDFDGTHRHNRPVAYNGLLATYYNNDDFTGTTFQRIDSTINFNWGTEGSPSLVPVSNSSFEATNLGTGFWGAYRQGGSDGGWNFTDFSWSATGLPSSSGVAADGCGYNRPNAPSGTQTAFIQGNGSMWQDVNFATAGNYAISLEAAFRDYYSGTNPIMVQVDGKTVGVIIPTSADFQTYHTDLFSVAAGTHRVSFTGMTSAGDCTSFIDNVAIGFEGTDLVGTLAGNDHGGSQRDLHLLHHGGRRRAPVGQQRAVDRSLEQHGHRLLLGHDRPGGRTNVFLPNGLSANSGAAYAKLEWSSASQAREVISSNNFQTADQTPTTIVPAVQNGIEDQPHRLLREFRKRDRLDRTALRRKPLDGDAYRNPGHAYPERRKRAERHRRRQRLQHNDHYRFSGRHQRGLERPPL